MCSVGSHWTVLHCIMITYTASSSKYEHSPYRASPLRYVVFGCKTDTNNCNEQCVINQSLNCQQAFLLFKSLILFGYKSVCVYAMLSTITILSTCLANLPS